MWLILQTSTQTCYTLASAIRPKFLDRLLDCFIKKIIQDYLQSDLSAQEWSSKALYSACWIPRNGSTHGSLLDHGEIRSAKCLCHWNLDSAHLASVESPWPHVSAHHVCLEHKISSKQTPTDSMTWAVDWLVFFASRQCVTFPGLL